jgi:hypothetical protein
LRLALSKGLKESVFLPSLEDGNRASFRDNEFSGYLKLQKMEESHKAIDFQCYIPSSELFHIYLVIQVWIKALIDKQLLTFAARRKDH